LKYPNERNKRMTIESLMNALQRAIDARHECNKAHDAYEGYSWGWAGSRVIKAVNKAQADFEEALVGFIDDRIRKALERKEQEKDD